MRTANAAVVFKLAQSGTARAFELLNKTNQFNLNGTRISEAEWEAIANNRECVVLTVGYTDRFGPLGVIAVLVGKRLGDGFAVSHWVMSCRAFSRHIEHRTMAWLFEEFSVDYLLFDFKLTARNQPTSEFLESISCEVRENAVMVRKDIFETKCPPLYHKVLADHKPEISADRPVYNR